MFTKLLHVIVFTLVTHAVVTVLQKILGHFFPFHLHGLIPQEYVKSAWKFKQIIFVKFSVDSSIVLRRSR